jgi:hypothetical protein
MDKRYSEEKQVNDIIDRIIAGEDVRIEPGMSQETTQKVRTAMKLAGCTADPSPEFQESLKRRLMLKYRTSRAEDSPKSAWSRFIESIGSLIPHSPVWQAAGAAVGVGLIVVIMWAAGLLPVGQGEQPPIVGTTGPAPVQVEPAAPGPVTVKAGTQFSVDILFRNRVDGTLVIDPFPPEIRINDPLDWMPVKTFAAGEGEFELLPSGKVSYTLTWDQRDNNGNQVPAGTYTVSVTGITVTEDGTPVDPFSANDVVRIEIVAP